MIPSNTFLDRYVQFAEKLTDAPVEFHQFMGYAVLSVALGKQIFFPFGGLNIYPNFYMTFIAPSSTFRKSTALSLGAKVIRKWKYERIFPAEFSQEKFIDILSRTPTGAFFFYEFKTLLGLLDRDYMQGTKAFLTELYDCPDFYSRQTKGTEVTLNDPCVSIISATTMNWFIEAIKQGDVEGGFLARFIFVLVNKKHKVMALPPAMEESELNKLVIWIEDIVKNIKGKMSLSDEARKTYEEWFKKQCAFLDNEENQNFKSSAVRLQIYLLKFAMLNAIDSSRSIIIGEDHMLSAINIINWLSKNTENIIKSELSDTKFGKDLKRVISYLKTHDNGGMPYRNVLRQLDLPTYKFNEIIQTLNDREEIEVSYEKKEGSRKASKWLKLIAKKASE